MEESPPSRKRQRSSAGRLNQPPALPAARAGQAPEPPPKKRKRETPEQRETREKLDAFKDKHDLWKPRTPGKSEHQRFATAIVLDSPEAPTWDYDRNDTVGYLVVVPVPLRAVYERGSDRHPAKLVKKYVKAIATASGARRSDQEATAAAQQRLRLLFCINKQDDFTNPALTSEAVEDELRGSCKELNQWFAAADLPAVMLPVLWAVAKHGAQEIYLAQDDVAEAERGHIDKLRRALAKLGLVAKPESLRPAYPFATVRSLALLTTQATEMIKQLARRNRRGVYVLTGDADLVSLHPVTKATSIFHSYDRKLGPGPELARAGGAYRFFADEIARHITTRYGAVISDQSFDRSVVTTKLVRALDNAIRGIFSRFAGLAYFAEPNTAHLAKLWDTDVFRVKLGTATSAPRGSLAKVTTNQKIGGNPDQTQKITEQLRRPTNWTGGKVLEQAFLPRREAQLVTSSRHDLVLLPADVVEHTALEAAKPGTDATVILDPLHSITQQIAAFSELHNPQLRASQLNERFSEAGFGQNILYGLVRVTYDLGLTMDFVQALWTRTDSRADAGLKVTGDARADAKRRANHYSKFYAGLGTSPGVAGLLSELEAVGSEPSWDKLCGPSDMAYRFDPLHGMDPELRDNDKLFQRLNGCGAKPTALFRAHALELLQMIVQAEMLFRWAARKLAEIRRLRFPKRFLDPKRAARSNRDQPDLKAPLALYSKPQPTTPLVDQRAGLKTKIMRPITVYEEGMTGSIFLYYIVHSGTAEVTSTRHGGYVKLLIDSKEVVRHMHGKAPLKLPKQKRRAWFIEESWLRDSVEILRLEDNFQYYL